MITFFKKSLKNQVTFFIYSVFTAGRVCVSNHTLPILNQQEAIRTDSPLFLNTNTFTIMAKKTAAPAKKAAAPAKKAAAPAKKAAPAKAPAKKAAPAKKK
jgi:hypothetical protein